MSVLLLEGNSNLEPCGFCPRHWAEIQKYLISECKSKKWQIPGLFLFRSIYLNYDLHYFPDFHQDPQCTALVFPNRLLCLIPFWWSPLLAWIWTSHMLVFGMVFLAFSQCTFKLCIIFTYPELTPGNTSHLILNEETSQMSSLQGDLSQTQLYPCAI